MMARKKSWFERFKRFFNFSDPKPKTEKEKRKRWFLGRFKHQPSFALPAPQLSTATSQRQVQEQSKIASAQQAPRVFRPIGKVSPNSPSQEIAAVKIQTAYRGCLARRALRALQGLVKLQALIRGQAVRRQMAITLRGLESLVKIQLQNSTRVKVVDEFTEFTQDEFHKKVHQGRQNWDNSPLSKEEMEAVLMSREEAALKRFRALQYASLHNVGKNRQLGISRDELDCLNQRWSWLEEWVDSQPFSGHFTVAYPTPPRYEQHRHRSSFAGVNDLESDIGENIADMPRRSFIRPRRAPRVHDGDATSCSSAFPSYMASTASAKAKLRSMSTPKERVMASEVYFPYNEPTMSPLPSVVSEYGGISRPGKPPAHNQRSPRLTGQMIPVKPR